MALRGYGQRDPLIEYKRIVWPFFALVESINSQIVYTIFKVTVDQAPQTVSTPMTSGTHSTNQALPAVKDDSGEKIGRNDPCPCGSGKNIRNATERKIRICQKKDSN